MAIPLFNSDPTAMNTRDMDTIQAPNLTKVHNAINWPIATLGLP